MENQPELLPVTTHELASIMPDIVERYMTIAVVTLFGKVKAQEKVGIAGEKSEGVEPNLPNQMSGLLIKK